MSGFVGFLKKFGQVSLEGLQIAAGIAPVVSPIIKVVAPGAEPTVTAVQNDLQSIAGIVQLVEVSGQANNLTGAQKLTAAIPLVEQIILSTDMLGPHKIGDPAKFKQGIASMTSGMADILSSLEPKVDTTNKKS